MDFCIEFIMKYIMTESALSPHIEGNYCNHFLVHSSLVTKLLYEEIDYFSMHKLMHDPKRLDHQSKAKNFLINKRPNLISGYSIKSSVLPFLVATCDFVEFKTDKPEEIGHVIIVRSGPDPIEVHYWTCFTSIVLHSQLQRVRDFFNAYTGTYIVIKKDESTNEGYQIIENTP